MADNASTPVDVVSNLPEDTTEQQRRVVEFAQKVLRGETTIKAELGLNDEQMEGMYAVAYNLYRSGKYEDARTCFAYLALFDPLQYRYAFGIASCLKLEGAYEMAAAQYALASGLDQAQPAPFLHMAECMLAVDEADSAKDALKIALEVAGDKPEYANLRDRASVILENIED